MDIQVGIHMQTSSRFSQADKESSISVSMELNPGTISEK